MTDEEKRRLKPGHKTKEDAAGMRSYAGFIPIQEIDPIEEKKMEQIGESIVQTLMKARNRAIMEGIRANTVVIDRGFARVHGFCMEDADWTPLLFPEMIAGMKTLFDDLPDERVAMYMLEMDPPPESRIKRLERENRELREKMGSIRRLIEKYDEV